MRETIKKKVFIIIGISLILTSSNRIYNDQIENNEKNNDLICTKNLKVSQISGRIHINNNWTDAESVGLLNMT